MDTALLRVFLFDDKPKDDMLAVIQRSQLDRPETKTYLKSMSINIYAENIDDLIAIIDKLP